MPELKAIVLYLLDDQCKVYAKPGIVISKLFILLPQSFLKASSSGYLKPKTTLKAFADEKLTDPQMMMFLFYSQKKNTWWEKEKMLGTSISFFSFSVFKKALSYESLESGTVW